MGKIFQVKGVVQQIAIHRVSEENFSFSITRFMLYKHEAKHRGLLIYLNEILRENKN